MKAPVFSTRLNDSQQYKLNNDSLRKVFLTNLNKIFCIKTYLAENLPAMANSSSFIDLKHALQEDADELKIQLLRLETIFAMLNETYEQGHCLAIKAYVMEGYRDSKQAGMTNAETDFTILYHLKAIEAIEIAGYDALHQLAQSMPDDDMSLLLQQNLDMAKESKELYDMITQEYIS